MSMPSFSLSPPFFWIDWFIWFWGRMLIVMPMVDYASAVIGAMLMLGIGNWFLHARGFYHGPRLE